MIAGSYVVASRSVARFTALEVTPGVFASVFSMTATHEAQVIPPTANDASESSSPSGTGSGSGTDSSRAISASSAAMWPGSMSCSA